MIDNLPNPELIEMKNDLKWLRKTLEGNGKKGFFQECDERFKKLADLIQTNSEFRIKISSNIGMIKFAAGSGWFIAAIQSTLVILMAFGLI